MDIARDAPATRLIVTASTPPQNVSQWRVGQVLDAMVRNNDAKTATLQIGRATVDVEADGQLRPGERLQVRILATEPTLRLSLSRAAEADPVALANRTLLPRQMPVNQLLGALQGVLSEPTSRSTLPDAVRIAATQLLAATPDSAALSSPEGLRQALRDSGLLFENKLGAVTGGQAPATLLQGDMKGLLSHFLNQVFRALSAQPRSTRGADQPPPDGGRQAPPPVAARPPSAADSGQLLTELGRLADGAIARTQSQQLVQVAQDGLPPWLFEVPVRHAGQVDLLQLAVDRDGETDASGQRVWSVRLSLDLSGLGPLHCNVTLQGRRVSTNWWAEHRETADHVGAHLDSLAIRIRDLGLEVGGMRCVHGRPPDSNRPRPDEGGLLDERA